MGEAVYAGDAAFHEDPAIGTGPANPYVISIGFLYQHNPPPSCSDAPVDYSRPT